MHIRSRAISTLLFSAVISGSFPAAAGAQQVGQMAECKKAYDLRSDNPQGKRPLQPNEKEDAARPWTTSGNVMITCDSAQLFADEIEYYAETNILKARGHVSFIEAAQRITAESLEFNTKTKLGTFYKAQGIMTIEGKPDTSGMFSPTDADAYFSGEVIEKTGVNTYKFKNGVFTTCVQPTPRWEIVGSKMIIVKDKRALLFNSVFRIKNVPVFYLPFMYYPITKDGRNTGFLMPSYGHDTFRGQTFSEAFFLVLGRSADATLNYEYASKTGSGYGGEARYIQAPGSEGNAQVRVLNGKNTADPLLRTRQLNMLGTVTQRLPGNWQLRGNVNYSNNVQARQLTQQDLLLSSDSSRYAGANVQGAIGKIRFTGETYVRDTFRTAGDSVIASREGRLPQVRAEWASAPIGNSKVYFGMAGDFAGIVRQDEISKPDTNRGLMRFDTHPTLRAPIGSLPYLGIVATVGMQFTYWNEQLNAQGLQVKQSLTRQLVDMAVQFDGPKFSKIFDTPGSRYATRWKHVIVPSVSISRLTAFNDVAKVAKNDSIDNIIGGTTNVSYGLANRLLAKRPALGGQAVEVASIALTQTYYSNSLAAAADTSYQGVQTASPFSAVNIIATVQPTTTFNGNAMLAYDAKYREFRSASAGVGLAKRTLNAQASWSKTFFIADLPGYNNKAALQQAITMSGGYRAPDNHLNARASWAYDFQNKHEINRGIAVSYMSQCCGVAVEYNSRYVPFATLASQNRIFKLSFSLGGIATFSPTGLFK